MGSIFGASEKAKLQKMVRDPHRHARFLNTLSLMELEGAKKLSRLFSLLQASSFLLEHVAEEYRHAFFLRHLSQKISGHEFDGFTNKTVFCLRLSKNYIKNIDRSTCILLHQHGLLSSARPHLPYLLTTLAIERRALPFYHLYQSVLDEQRLPINIKSIIAEEQNHLVEIHTRIEREQLPTKVLDSCFTIENSLFSAWFTALSSEIA